MKSLLKLTLGVLCLIVSSVFVFKLMSNNTDSIDMLVENEPTAITQIENSPVDTKINYYIVRSYNNNIAVFEDGEEEPYKIFDKDIRILPKIDQERLNKGIRVTSDSDLKRLLEDYTS